MEREEINKEGPFPVIKMVESGEGRVVFMSDASMFINDMLDRYDNKELFFTIVEQHLGNKKGGEILFYDCTGNDIAECTYATLVGYLIFGYKGLGIFFIILSFGIIILLISIQRGDTTIPTHIHVLPIKGLIRCIKCNHLYEPQEDMCPNCGSVYYDTFYIADLVEGENEKGGSY